MIIREEKNQPADYTALNKAIRIFVRRIDKASRFKIQSEKLTFSDFLENKMLIIQAIREGFPHAIFVEIAEISPFTEDDWAIYLNVSKKTLQRHKSNKDYVFKPIHTEKIIELAEVTNFGKSVFDSAQQFYLWLNTPSYALGNIKPAELLKDSYGKEMVLGELNRIDRGIFA